MSLLITVATFILPLLNYSASNVHFTIKPREDIFDTVKRLPDVSEDSSVASGKITKYATMKDLVYTNDPILEFKYVKKNEIHYMTKRCRNALLKLARQLYLDWNDQCRIKVIESFAAVKRNIFRNDSLHYEGRALDLKLIESSSTRRNCNQYCKGKMKKFAWMAKFVANFDFVELKTRHIHVSCKKEPGE